MEMILKKWIAFLVWGTGAPWQQALKAADVVLHGDKK